MQPIPVLQVLQSLRPGGLENVVLDIVNHVSDSFPVTVCCLEDAGPWRNRVTSPGVRLIALAKRPGLDWRLVGRIAGLVRRERIRIVHTHNCAAHLYGALGGKLGGAKVLHTEHHPKLGGEETRVNRINRFAAPFTDFTVGVSRKLAEIAGQYEGVPRRKLGVVYNGIPVERYAAPVDPADLRTELGLPTTARLIGSVGRLAEQKNFPLLLEAFRELATLFSDAYLVIAGDGPLHDPLRALAQSLGLERRVLFLGTRRDVPRLLGSFDVFALASHNEGHPIAVLEAMATACPIVVTAVPGNVEVITDGQTGRLVPAGDAPVLSAALRQLLTDRALAQQLGQRARATVRARFSVQEMVRQYQTLWRQLADGIQPASLTANSPI